jgi:predicted DNA-binding transcriptional regulator YafY
MGNLGLDEQRLQEAFSSSWNEYAPAEGQVFQKVTTSLLENRILNFSYTSPKEQTLTVRTVEPHHLQHYMGSWTMIGFCRLRVDWRRFMLSRMTDLALTNEMFRPQTKEVWANQVAGGFGIFQGGELKKVTLRFNKFRSAWIREQIWHPQQTLIERPDGSLDLSFPVCEFHEVKMKILQFGGDVEVLEPPELRDGISEEVNKLKSLYC